MTNCVCVHVHMFVSVAWSSALTNNVKHIFLVFHSSSCITCIFFIRVFKKKAGTRKAKSHTPTMANNNGSSAIASSSITEGQYYNKNDIA